MDQLGRASSCQQSHDSSATPMPSSFSMLLPPFGRHAAQTMTVSKRKRELRIPFGEVTVIWELDRRSAACSRGRACLPNRSTASL